VPRDDSNAAVTAGAERRVAAESVKYALVDAVQQAISVVVTPIALLYLTFDEFGVVTGAIVLSQIALSLSTGGLDLAIIRFYYQTSEKDRAQLVGAVSAVALASTLVLGAALSAGLPENAWEGPFLLGWWGGLALGLRNVFIAVMRMRGDFSSYAATMIGGSTAQAIAQLILLAAGWGVSGYLIGYAAAAAASMLFAWLTVARHLTVRPNSLALGRDIRRYILSVWPSVILNRFLLVLDRIVLGRFADLSVLGVYGAATRMTAPLKLVSGGFKLALSPALARAESEGLNQGSLVDRLGRLLVVVMLLLGSLLATVMWFAAFTPWAPRATELQQILGVLLVAQFLSALSVMGQVSAYFSRSPQDASIVAGVSGFVLVLGLLLFIPAGGLGAAAAQLLSGACGFAVVVITTARRPDQRFGWLGLGVWMLPFLPAVMAPWILGRSGQLITLLLTTLAYGGMLAILLLRLRADDRRWVFAA
jgi:O-antigen/teichoic acid export membrane protein